MKLSEFRSRLRKYEELAKANRQNRFDARDDTSYEMCVVQEMLMDMIERLERVEDAILPPDREIPERPKHADTI